MILSLKFVVFQLLYELMSTGKNAYYSTKNVSPLKSNLKKLQLEENMAR